MKNYKKLLLGLTLLATTSAFAVSNEDVEAAIVYTKITASIKAQADLFPKDGDLCQQLKDFQTSGKLESPRVIGLVDQGIDSFCD